MQVYELIIKKRDGGELTSREIEFLIEGYVQDRIPDYQMSALAMAIYYRGMSAEETIALTRAMVETGDTIDFSDISGFKVDKHSTGGVGDKVSLVLIPFMASLGLKCPKMSGRGLGHTGGTVDKLEGIPGFNIDLTSAVFKRQVEKIGAAIIGQTGNLTPGDKKLYSLRDVTGTVDSIPLIASSIMSKKIAAGAENIVLDVKFGAGALMESVEKARKLAQTLVQIGKGMGRNTVAVLTSMEQPLGRTVGNNIEVQEAISTLRGKGPEDLEKVVLELAAAAYSLKEKEKSPEEIRGFIQEKWRSGAAYPKFKEWIETQGGQVPEKFSLATPFVLKADEKGYVGGLDAKKVGQASVVLGAGRQEKEDKIDHTVGIELEKKIGDPVERGEALARIFARDEKSFSAAQEILKKAWKIQGKRPKKPPLIMDIIK